MNDHEYWIVERGSGGALSKATAWIEDTSNQIWTGAAFKHSEWFSLLRDDLGIDDSTWVKGVKREHFRLHPGTVSKGCITLVHNSDYTKLREALLKTNIVQQSSFSPYHVLFVL